MTDDEAEHDFKTAVLMPELAKRLAETINTFNAEHFPGKHVVIADHGLVGPLAVRALVLSHLDPLATLPGE